MEPIIKAIDVQYCTLQCPDLDIQEQFLIHFGMHTVEKKEDILIMRGEGPKPFIEICKKGERKFLGAAFLAASMEDLEKISKTDPFSEIETLSTPGGGFISKGTDPDGINVEVVFGIDDRSDFKEINESETNKTISEICEKLKLSTNKAEKDIGIYKSSISKMEQAKELIEEQRLKDKKKT